MFSEERLPSLSERRNTLEGDKLAVSEEKLSHANQMWKLLGCKTLQDPHDAYLKLDCALSACVCDFHRELSFRTYKLDCMYFYTLHSMAREAPLKVCKANIELVTEREHLDMTEPAIRGGVTSVYEEYHFVANNKYLSDYMPSEESTFAFCVDANKLYGGVKQMDQLPLGEFAFNVEITLNEILITPNDASVDYFLEADLNYPVHLHDDHRHFPLAPTKDVVQDEWLGDYQLELNEHHRLPSSNVKELLQTLFHKKNYVLHCKLLKLYVSLGLIVAELHRELQFKQANWLAPYITIKSNKRQTASNKFEEKLMNSAVYGKNCESRRRRSKLTFRARCRSSSVFYFKVRVCRFVILGDNLAASSFSARKIYQNTPKLSGATMLDLAKYQMYSCHYYTMRAHFDCRLLYSDTDNLLYKIRSIDLYDDLARKPASVVSGSHFSNFLECSLFIQYRKKTGSPQV